jgi:hypothetical protein
VRKLPRLPEPDPLLELGRRHPGDRLEVVEPRRAEPDLLRLIVVGVELAAGLGHPVALTAEHGDDAAVVHGGPLRPFH